MLTNKLALVGGCQPGTLNCEPLNLDGPMQVHVDTYANLRQYAPAGRGSFDLTLDAGATVKSVIEALGIPRAVKMVLLVNGRRAAEDTRLETADRITLFPPIEGG